MVPPRESTLNPRTGLFGYRTYYECQSPHDRADTFTGVLMVSRAYVPGSVMGTMSTWNQHGH